MFAHTFDVHFTVRSHLMEPNEVNQSEIVAALKRYADDLADMDDVEFSLEIKHISTTPCL